MKKIGVIGIGNTLRKDDAIGLIILKKLIEKKDHFPKNVDFIDGATSGFSLIHILNKFEIVFIIDAVNINGEIGQIKMFKPSEVNNQNNIFNLHEPNLLNIINLSKEISENPEKIFIIGIQPKDTSHGLDISIELQNKTDIITNEIFFKIKENI